jgi:methionine biosynthesis protein MetW
VSGAANRDMRADFGIIAEMVRPGARVLDLGCGDGSLMRHLAETRGVSGYGIEIADANVLAAMKNGVNVLQGNLERGLRSFADASFDTVLLSQTLQAMRNIEALMKDMVRVGREAVVSFPNFRYEPHFRQLEAGRMPVSDTLPYQWHDTPNVHLCTLADFEDLCGQLAIGIVERVALAEGRLVLADPNIHSELAIYRVRAAA